MPVDGKTLPITRGFRKKSSLKVKQKADGVVKIISFLLFHINKFIILAGQSYDF